MSGWAIAIGALALPSLLLGLLSLRMLRRPTCPKCCYPAYRCDCPPSCEHSYWPWRWSEDGWIKVCRGCGDIAYGGDGPEPVEPE